MKTKLCLPGLLALVCILSLDGCSPPAPTTPSVSGTIECDVVRLASRYGGRVEKILAREGDQLRTGDVLVELDAAELVAQRDQAKALLAELVAGPRMEEIDAARHDWESVVAELDLARLEANRTEKLFADKTISEGERDSVLARARTLEKNVAAAKSRHDLLLAGTRPERIAQAKASLAQVETQLKEMRLVTPTNTTVEVLNVKVGDVVGPNREVATLLLPGYLWARVFVPEPWLGHIKVGEKVSATVDGFPAQNFSGVVEQIQRSAEFTPRNVQTVEERVKQVFGVKIRLENSDDKLRAGMTADVVFSNVPK